MIDRWNSVAARHATMRARQRYGVRFTREAYLALCDRIATGEHARFVSGIGNNPNRTVWLVLHEPFGWMLAVYCAADRVILSFPPMSTQYTDAGKPFWNRLKHPRGVTLRAMEEP